MKNPSKRIKTATMKALEIEELDELQQELIDTLVMGVVMPEGFVDSWNAGVTERKRSVLEAKKAEIEAELIALVE